MARFAERIAALSPEQRELFERRLRREGLDPGRVHIVPRRRAGEPCPLSFAQHRLWLIDQLLPGTALYNMPAAVRITGPLDAAALQASLDHIVARHEALRTTFAVVGGEPVQEVAPRLALRVDAIDLAERPDPEREAEVRRLALEEARRPFDLARGPLLRATLLRLAPAEHVLLVTMHHIVSDGWSLRVLVQEALALSAARAAGLPPGLALLPIQYADFAAWQRERLCGAALDELLAYWTTQLAGAAPLDLPTDRPRAALPSHRAGTLGFQVEAAVLDGLRALGRREGASMFMTVLAAFKAVLHHESGRQDVLVSTPIAGRNHAGLEGLIGCFVNLLLLRSDLGGDPTFRELVGRVRDVALAAYAHQDLPVELLLEQPRGAGAAPLPTLAQVAFGLDALPADLSMAGGLGVAPLDLPRETIPVELSLQLFEVGGALTARLDYSADLFDTARIAALRDRFVSALERAVADPDLRLSALRPPAPAPLEEATNLTQHQLQIWTALALAPGLPTYNQPALIRIDALLDADRFERAFAALVRRTDALRTVIEEVDGIPRQRVAAPPEPALERVDLSAEPDPPAALRAWAQARARRVLDPSRRLHDAALVRLGADRHAWYVNLHHAVGDGWSFSLLTRRLHDLYTGAAASGAPPEGPAFPGFDAFVERERGYRASPRFSEDAAYWRAKLARGAEPLTYYDRERSRRGTRAVRLTRDLGAERTRRLEALAARPEFAERTANLARFHLFLAVLAAFLHRLSGRGALAVGVPLLNRPSRAFKETVGLFSQMAPIRVEVGGADTLASLVRRSRAELNETLRHQRHAVRNTHGSAYEIALNLHTALPERALFGGAIRAEWVYPGHATTALYLTVDSPEYTLGHYELQVDLHCDVFDEGDRERLVDQLVRVIDAFLDDPGRRVGSLDLLGPDERARVLVELNRTAAAYPADGTLPDLFEAQVRRSPERVALVFEGRSLSYGELDARANRLARALRSRGVGSDSRVGVCLERSFEMVVALLAVLKAGGAYVPLDPEYPDERLAAMIEDAGAAVVLAAPGLVSRVSALAGAALAVEAGPAVPGPDEAPVPGGARPDTLAYVIYTSGSTGRPKGVMIPHRGIVNRLHWMQQAYGLGEGDRVLQKTPFGFDVSVWEFFWPLVTGARLVIARPGGHRDGAYLVRLIAKEEITTLHFVPSMLQAFLDEPDVEACASVRRVICSGEALSVDLQERFFARFAAATLDNLYGPTEASVDVTAWACRRGDDRRTVPIGHPIANTRMYVLDAAGDPVPMGAPGDLYIGGVGLARGYAARPELTAAAFVPDRWGPEPGARLYRTGDVARHLPDGAIEFLGRRDQQVKLRGFRIELEEIEAALARHPGVRAAAVRLRGEGDDARLEAFVVPAAPPAPPVAELREHLRAALPEYMIPAVIAPIAALPLSPSGKLDRRALPDALAAGVERVVVLARDDTERAIAAIWEDLLDVRPVGVTESFFDLGGHSLLALRLMLRVKALTGEVLPLASLAQGPTIERMARLVRQRAGAVSDSPLVALTPSGTQRPLFCVAPIGGTVLGYFELARHLGPDQPVYGLQAPGADGRGEPVASIPDLAAHYVAALRRAQPAGPYRLAGHSFGGLVAFEMAHQLESAGEAVELVALLDVARWRPAAVLTDADAGRLIDDLSDEFGLSLDRGRFSLARFVALEGEAQIDYALDQLEGSGGVIGEVGRAEARRHVRVILAHARAAAAHAPRPVRGRVVLLRAAAASALVASDPLDWAPLAVAGVETVIVPGDHFSILREPHVRALADHLRAAVARAAPAASAGPVPGA